MAFGPPISPQFCQTAPYLPAVIILGRDKRWAFLFGLSCFFYEANNNIGGGKVATSWSKMWSAPELLPTNLSQSHPILQYILTDIWS